MTRRWLGLLVVLGTVSVLPGCGLFRRVSDCRRLAEHVNSRLDAIAAIQDAGAGSAASYHDAAGRYEALGKDLESFGTRNEALARNLKEYAVFFQDTARSTKLLADALEKNDAVTVARLRRELGNLSRRERTLVTRIDGVCTSP